MEWLSAHDRLSVWSGVRALGDARGSRRRPVLTCIAELKSTGVVTVLVGLVILGSVSEVVAWGSKGHRIIGLIARELLSPETSARLETIMGSADLAIFGLYLDDNKIGLSNTSQVRALGTTTTFQSAGRSRTASTVRTDRAPRHKSRAIEIFLLTLTNPRLASSSPSGFWST